MVIEEVELVAIRPANYTMYVFKKLNLDEYIMCTRLPNWQVPDVEIGDKGFLQYSIVEAGEVYYDPNTEIERRYQYSNIYFNNFVKRSEVVKKESIII